MTIAPHLMSIYQQLLDLSQGMLRLATQGQWDELIALEVDYVSVVQKLAQSNNDASMTPGVQEMLSPVLRHILDNESEVKNLLQQRLDEISSLIGQNNRQKTVMTAYGQNAGLVLVPREGV